MLDRIFANSYDRMMASSERAGLADIRRTLVGELRGDVLEIGAGTGLNLEQYPVQMSSLTLTEPSDDMAARLRTRVAKIRPSTTLVVAPADDLPFDDASFDTVVSTLVLCTVPDVPAALAEIRRVLRPDGSLVMLEHVATDTNWHYVQRALGPAWKVLARGCHLRRDTRSALVDAGFDDEGVITADIPAPPWVKTTIRGAASVA